MLFSKKFVAVALLCLVGSHVLGAEPLPNQTYYADPLRSIFSAGNFDPKDGEKPKGWSDVGAFADQQAKLSDRADGAVELSNEDVAKSVQIQTLVAVDAAWHWVAVSAILYGQKLAASDSPEAFAGLEVDVLDKEKKVLEVGVQLSPLTTGKYTGQKAKMATFGLPEGAAFLAVTPKLALTTGMVAVSHIVIMPADPDKEADPSKVVALHKFIKSGNVDAVRKMLTDRRMVECRNNDYDIGTPVIGAAWGGKADILQALIDKGADVEAVDQNYHATAVYWAAYWGRPAALKLLLSLAKHDTKELMQAVTVGRSRNHKNTPDGDFQTCLDLLNNPALTLPAQGASTLP